MVEHGGRQKACPFGGGQASDEERWVEKKPLEEESCTRWREEPSTAGRTAEGVPKTQALKYE